MLGFSSMEARRTEPLAAVFTAIGLIALGLSLAVSHAAVAVSCPNEAFRSGPSADLPDCRAYELVTPPASNGRRFADLTVLGRDYDLFPTALASSLNGSFVFSTVGSALQNPQGGNGRNDGDVYEAQRAVAGWQVVRHVTPSGKESVGPLIGGMSPDHGYIFTFAPQFGESGSLASDGEADYLGDSSGHFELTGIGELGSERLAQGRYISASGGHVIFSTGRTAGGSAWCAEVGVSCPVNRLELKAPPAGTGAIYDRAADGPTKVVSLLPNDITPAAGQDAEYQGASRDGTTVAFKIAGTLYVHVSDEEDGETLKAAEGNPAYAGLSDEGRYLFYVTGGESGNIHRFDTSDESDDQINSTGDGEVVNVSADGSHVYFISKSQIGGQGTAGQPNMYVWSGSAPDFVTTVAPSDLERTSGEASGYPALPNWIMAVAPLEVAGPGTDSSRSTPDGRVLVFESKAKLATYENAGHTEIYRYDDEAKNLKCVSCNTSMAAATADARLQNLAIAHRKTILYNLSSDGSRVFFETEEALVGDDVDGINDIYEWQKLAGGGETVDLISSGVSADYSSQLIGSAPEPNALFGINPSGNDVFFLSQDALAPGAGTGGASAIYDARVGGGFPEAVLPPECMELAVCQGSGSASPSLLAPQSTRPRSGNVKPRRQRCNRRKHQKHRHCKRHKHRGGKSR